MTNAQFELVTSLQYAYRDAKRRLKEFETGEKYVSMKAGHSKQLSEKDTEIKKVKLELGQSRCREVTIRNNYLQIIEGMEKEHAKELRAKDNRIKGLFERSLRGERRADTYQDEIRDLKKQYYEIAAKYEDLQERNGKLIAQLRRDHENSSMPSSAKPNRKKIHNSREKSGKKPGGQPGHEGYGRKWREPTNRIDIEPPKEYMENPDYIPTGKIIKKQVVRLSIDVIVDEYSTPEFKNLKTNQLVHAAFPDGTENEVCYDGGIKAIAFMLNNYCNVPIEKVREFLSEITDGRLKISHGMISGLSKEFSQKTQAERQRIFGEILRAPTVCTDFTSARNAGKQVNVIVCATPVAVSYFARLHKGRKGVEGTPVEDYQGTLVHDHDKTFYNYGSNHQECNAHPLRYLKGSIENEPHLTWNVQMRGLLQEMIHYRNLQEDDSEPDLVVVEAYKSKYREILDLARSEYEFEPPSKYNVDGYNLFMRLDEYMDYHFTFLIDHTVPATNNLSERLLRLIKRKQKQAVTFRSFEGLGYFCDAMSVIGTLRLKNRNLYLGIAGYFQ